MRNLNDLTAVHIENSWVTIGSFDGIHLGHQNLITDLVRTAHAQDETAVVITFFPHPQLFLRNIPTSYYLTTPDEKKTLMAKMGVDILLTLNFNQHLADFTADDFVALLKNHLGMKALWVGEGFTLGKDQQGNVSTLQNLSIEMGFEFKVHELFWKGSSIASSSAIRQTLSSGHVEDASEMLGRLYRVEGKVIHGDGRGKGLGFPTANIEYDPLKFLPANGIYATWNWWKRKRFPSVTNLGVRPTFSKEELKPTMESYIIGFDQDLYNEIVTVEFLKYLRPEQKFSTTDELKKRIQQDIEEANEVFTHAPRTPGLSS